MEVHATTYQKVNIDPIDVIEKLLSEKLGNDGNFVHIGEDKKFYKVIDWGRYEEGKEISKEEYDYIQALLLVLDILNKCYKK